MFATPLPSPSPSASFLLQKPQNPLSLVPIRPTSPRCLRLTSFHMKSSNISQPGHREQAEEEEEEEEPIVGDCLVFEQGIFEDPFPVDDNQRAVGDKEADVSPQNLIPENWIGVQKELNIPKKERRKLAREMEYGRKVEKRRQALMPIADHEQYKRDKLKQLKPIVLDKPLPQMKSTVEEAKEEVTESDGDGSVKGRVEPRNPRLAVYGKGGGGLEDISVFFNSGRYDPASGADDKAKGSRKLFTKEEKALLNRRVPDLAVATSGKWHPLHTLAASGEFYLVNSLLKHGLDINAPDKDGLTAIHKAILGKKQAVFNFLLRESANPFIRDEDGATLMHYAVFAASTEMIKILLLYNVNINLQDNDGWTPLHLAVQSRRTDIVRLLLIKGADKTIKNRDGLTPLDLCLYSGKETRTYELIKLIKRFP